MTADLATVDREIERLQALRASLAAVEAPEAEVRPLLYARGCIVCGGPSSTTVAVPPPGWFEPFRRVAQMPVCDRHARFNLWPTMVALAAVDRVQGSG